MRHLPALLRSAACCALLAGCPAPTTTEVKPIAAAAGAPAAAGAEKPAADIPPIAGAEGYVVFPAVLDIVDQEEAAACIAAAITRDAPQARAIDPARFRDALYPWMEPTTKPRYDDQMEAFARMPHVRERLRQIGLRYLIQVDGRRSDGAYRSTSGCAGTGCFSAGSQSMASSLSATVWDLTEVRPLGRIDARSSGTSFDLVVGIIPIVFIPYTGARVCTEAGDAIGRAMAAGTPK